MKLEELNAPTLQKAIEIYMAQAWGDQAQEHWPTLGFGAQAQAAEILRAFRSESAKGGMRKYTLRLGNRQYPFMKLVFQELIRRDAFFFAVDAHDDLDIRKGFPDYDEWLSIKSKNSGLKREIEQRWDEESIDTMTAVVAEVERTTPAPTRDLAADAPLLLVVDDEAPLLRCSVKILGSSGFRVLAAHSAEEASQILQERTPDLILSDLDMLGWNGLDLARMVEDNPLTKDIPFVLMSTSDVRGRDLFGVDEFIQKPFEAGTLVETVRRQLGRTKAEEHER